MHYSASWGDRKHAKNIQPNRTILLLGGVCFSLSDKTKMHAQTAYMHSSTLGLSGVLECMYGVCAYILAPALSEKPTPPGSNIVRFGGMFFAWNSRPHDAPWCTMEPWVSCLYVTQDLLPMPYGLVLVL